MRKLSHLILLLFMSGSVILLVSCPEPINVVTLRQMTDEHDPVITILAPEDGSDYAQTVTVQGTVLDSSGKIRFLSYLVAGTLGLLRTGEIDPAQIAGDGSFSFQFTTIDFNGPIVVTVIAEDWNDNVGESLITLRDPGSAISSFSVAPGNKMVGLSWESVPGATGYILYYTDNGTLPSESYGQSVNLGGSPYDLIDLRNGAVYTFLLRAQMPGGGDYWSDYEGAIPLSEFTLAPLVKGGYREIVLEWAEIDGTDEFEILRGLAPTGPYSNYTGVIQGNSFTDTSVADDQWYYYKVKPAVPSGVISTYNGSQTVQIPSSYNRVTSLNTAAATQKVRIDDRPSYDYAYVAAGPAGLMVIDISNPSAPSIETTLTTVDARDLDIAGTYIYIADGAGGITSVDISNPAAPILRQTFNDSGTIGDAIAISVAGGRAYVLDSTGGSSIHVINLANPLNMSIIDTYTEATYTFKDLAASYFNTTYTFVYIATGTGDALLESYFYASAGGGDDTVHGWRSFTDPDYFPEHVTVDGSYAYFLGRRNVDIEPPNENALLVLTKYPDSAGLTKLGVSGETSGYAADVRVVGDRAYTVDSYAMQVFDVSDPNSPTLIDYLDTPGGPTGIDADGSYAFIATGVLLFQTVDLVLPTSLSVVGTYNGGGTTGLSGAQLRGNYVYAAASSPNRLQVIEVSTVSSPVERGSAAMTSPKMVAISGNYAFVADGSSGLKIVNITNPLAPAEVGSAPPISGSTTSIAVKGDYAFLSASSGLHIYDISNPIQPIAVGLFDSDPGGMKDVEVRGHFAYVTDGAYFQPNSLKIVDVSNPESPILVGKASTGVLINGVSLYGDYAFISDSYGLQGVAAVNINPGSGSFLTVSDFCDVFPDADPGSAEGLAVFGGYAYVTDSTAGNGLAVIDISNPPAITDSSLITNLDWGSTGAHDVTISGKHAFVSDTSEGLKIISLFP